MIAPRRSAPPRAELTALLALVAFTGACSEAKQKPRPSIDSGATDSAAGDGAADGSDGAEDGGDDGTDTGPIDADGDGYTADVDCDEAAPEVNPGAEEVPGDGIDNDCDPTTCGGAGFASAATTYALPPGYPSLTFIAPQREARCGDGLPALITRDLNGDRRADLVILQSPCGDAEPGLAAWSVHLGGEAGFAEAAVAWPLPAGFPSNTFVSKGAAPDCALGRPGYSLIDLNGDQRDDLVLTAPACGAGEPGLTAWEVYLNEGGGFASAPLSWPLPTEGRPPDGLRQLGGPPDCGSGQPGYSLIDLDRDRQPELVVWSAACGGAGPGEGSWDRYDNVGVGFAAAPRPWALPPGRFAGLASPADCGAGQPGWATLDLNGDRLPDLLLGEDCAPDTSWQLYPGGAEGFAATPVELGLPDAIPAGSMTSPALAADCALGNPGAGLVDIGGGPAPELLLLAEACGDGPLGVERWLSHRFAPTGYTSAPLEVALPEGYGPAAFRSVGAERSCAAERPGWLLQDFSGDSVPDVVVTAQACLEGSLGVESWAVHLGSCPP